MPTLVDFSEIVDEEGDTPVITISQKRPPPSNCLKFEIDMKKGTVEFMFDPKAVSNVDKGIWEVTIELRDNSINNNLEEQVNKYAFNVTINYIMPTISIVAVKEEKNVTVIEDVVEEEEPGIPPVINTLRSG